MHLLAIRWNSKLARNMQSDPPTVRPANLDDSESIAGLIFRSHTISFAPYASEDWVDSRRLNEYVSRAKRQIAQAATTPDDSTFVALIDGTVVGAVRVARLELPDREFDAQLIGMHVEPELTGRGIGSLLMKCAVAFIEERGFKHVELGVIAANSRTRRFYEAHGWVLVRELSDGIEGVPVAIYKLG